MIRDPLTADVFLPLPPVQADRIAELASSIGRQTADLAVLLFPLPMPAGLRQRFEDETLAAIGVVLDGFGSLTPSDRTRFQAIAALSLERRLSHHAARDASGSA